MSLSGYTLIDACGSAWDLNRPGRLPDFRSFAVQLVDRGYQPIAGFRIAGGEEGEYQSEGPSVCGSVQDNGGLLL